MHELLGPRHIDRSLREKQLLQSMALHRRARFVDGGHQSLQHVMEASTYSWEIGLLHALKTGGAMETWISPVIGGPGVGKTHITEKVIIPFYDAFAERIQERYGITPVIIHTSWDRDLGKLIRNGFIRPKPDGSLPQQAIHLNTVLHQGNLAYAMGGEEGRILFDAAVELSRYHIPAARIHDAFRCITEETARQRGTDAPKIIVEETVAGTSSILPNRRGTKMQRRWLPQSRPYNNKLPYHLLFKDGMFSGLPDFRVGARVGFIGGVNMDVFGEKYRGLLQTLPTLEAVNRLNELLGLPIIETEEEWGKRKVGATPASVRLAHRKMAATARFTVSRLADRIGLDFLSETEKFSELEEPRSRAEIELVAHILNVSSKLIAWRRRQRDGEANVLANLLCLDDPDIPPFGAVIENNPPLNLDPGSEDELRELFATI